MIDEMSEDCAESKEHLIPNYTPSRYGSTSDKDKPSADGLTAASSRSRHRRLLVALAVVNALNGCLMAATPPFWPVEAARRGVSQTLISGAFTGFALTQVAVYPLIGRLAPRLGVTRVFNAGVAVTGLITVVFGALFYIPGGTGFIVGCYLGRMVEAVGRAALTVCSLTIIGNQFPERASSAMALITASQSVGMAIAPSINSGLFTLAGFSLPFYVTGGALLLAAVVNHHYMPAVEQKDTGQRHLLDMLRTAGVRAENWLCMLIVFSYALAFSTIASAMASYADRALDITPATYGLYITASPCANVLMSFVWARLAERAANPYPVMSLCLLVVTGAQLLIPPSPLLGLQPRRWVLVLGLVLHEGMYGGAYIPCFQLMLRASVRAGLADDLRTHALVSSMFRCALSLGIVVGPLVGGLLVDAYGLPVMMTVMAAESLTVAALTAAQAVSRACTAKADRRIGGCNSTK